MFYLQNWSVLLSLQNWLISLPFKKKNISENFIPIFTNSGRHLMNAYVKAFFYNLKTQLGTERWNSSVIVFRKSFKCFLKLVKAGIRWRQNLNTITTTYFNIQKLFTSVVLIISHVIEHCSIWTWLTITDYNNFQHNSNKHTFQSIPQFLTKLQTTLARYLWRIQ